MHPAQEVMDAEKIWPSCMFQAGVWKFLQESRSHQTLIAENVYDCFCKLLMTW